MGNFRIRTKVVPHCQVVGKREAVAGTVPATRIVVDDDDFFHVIERWLVSE
jgi:hypothetical protein